jgi:hypothetical protein
MDRLWLGLPHLSISSFLGHFWVRYSLEAAYLRLFLG